MLPSSRLRQGLGRGSTDSLCGPCVVRCGGLSGVIRGSESKHRLRAHTRAFIPCCGPAACTAKRGGLGRLACSGGSPALTPAAFHGRGDVLPWCCHAASKSCISSNETANWTPPSRQPPIVPSCCLLPSPPSCSLSEQSRPSNDKHTSQSVPVPVPADPSPVTRHRHFILPLVGWLLAAVGRCCMLCLRPGSPGSLSPGPRISPTRKTVLTRVILR